jgi:hypothetical protein
MDELQAFGTRWSAFMPLVGACFTGLMTLGAAGVATWSLNRSMKRTEFFLRFTERFHNIMLSKHNLELRLAEVDDHGVKKIKDETAKKEASELYRQLFGLMFDEFFAYRRGLLDRSAFVEWMRWRNYECKNDAQNNPNFQIGPTSYQTGWDTYSRLPLLRSEFTEFLTKIHRLTLEPGAAGDREIAKVVKEYGTRCERFGSKYRALCFVFVLVIAGGWALHHFSP